MRANGFILLEILLVLAISALGCIKAFTSFKGLVYRYHAAITLSQIQQAVLYARSVAVANSANVTVCPGQDGRCVTDWDGQLLVLASDGRVKIFKLYVGVENELSLVQSGFRRQRLEVLPDGLTNNNGHFNYMPRKTCDFPKFTLYFNKAFRFYLDTE